MMKKIQLKQFVESATDWTNFNEFTKARLKITLYYLLVIFILLNIFAGALFIILRIESDNYQNNVNVYFNQEKSIYMNQDGFTVVSMQPQVVSFNTNDLINYHKIFVDIIQKWLFKIEFLLLILSGFLSYFLAGISMRPIEEKNKKTKKFLADVSHELKNPLSALKMSLDVSKQQKHWRVGEIEEVFCDLEDEVSRLIKITEDLLILEEVKRKVVIEKINIKEIVLSVLKQLKPFFQKKNLKIESKLEDFYFKINNKDIEKVIFNILHNAIKFSKQNGIVEVNLTKDGKLSIKDYGIGIPKRELKNIFDRFYKIDNARALNRESGSGLGLSIVKDITDKYKINTKVSSSENNFTEFILKLSK